MSEQKSAETLTSQESLRIQMFEAAQSDIREITEFLHPGVIPEWDCNFYIDPNSLPSGLFDGVEKIRIDLMCNGSVSVSAEWAEWSNSFLIGMDDDRSFYLQYVDGEIGNVTAEEFFKMSGPFVESITSIFTYVRELKEHILSGTTQFTEEL